MCDRPQSAMIFAAGRGTRMAPLTDTLPKPLIPVAGKLLIDHALDLVAGIPTIVVNTHYRAEMINAHLGDRNVTLIHEPELLETGGGLRNALPYLGEGPVLTLNSDAIWRGPNVVEALCAAWRPHEMDALLSIVLAERAKGHRGIGDFTYHPDQRLTRKGPYIYTGAQITTTERLRQSAEMAFSMNTIWDEMLVDRRLYGLPYDGLWCDVGQPESIAIAEAMMDV